MFCYDKLNNMHFNVQTICESFKAWQIMDFIQNLRYMLALEFGTEHPQYIPI